MARCSTIPGSFKSKEESETLPRSNKFCSRTIYPELYAEHIRPQGPDRVLSSPRETRREGWDNIDIFGWLGYPMQIKINFLCRDSILAAPLVLDIMLFMDLAQRAGMRGVQERGSRSSSKRR